MKQNGFASTNIVFGIGSFTYQHVTRDTYGFAIKATYAEVRGRPIEMFKAPKTDDGTKTSLKGLIRVVRDQDGNYHTYDQQTPEQEESGLLELVYKDGNIVHRDSFQTIRNRLLSNLE
jgi:nicotinamide phosphoribosyltransferase